MHNTLFVKNVYMCNYITTELIAVPKKTIFFFLFTLHITVSNEALPEMIRCLK